MLALRRVGVKGRGTSFDIESPTDLSTGLLPKVSVLGEPAGVTMDGASAPSVVESPLSWLTGETRSVDVVAVPGLSISFVSMMTGRTGRFSVHMLS